MATAPNPINYIRGGVACIIRRSDDASNKYLDLGNIVSPTTNITEDTLTHETARDGLLREDRRDTIRKTIELAFSLDEFSPEILNIIFNGSDTTDYTQSSGSIAGTESATAKLGYGVYLANKKISNLVVENASVTLVEGTDYRVDTDLGFVTFYDDAANVSDGDEVSFSYDYAAISDGKTFNVLNDIEGVELNFVQWRHKDAKGKIRVWEFNKGYLSVNGGLELPADDWSNIPVTISVQYDPNDMDNNTYTEYS